MDTLINVLVSLRAEIHRRHRHQLRCIGCRVDTDDLYQAVCMKAWKARNTCRGSSAGELRNWVLKIAANEVRSLLDAHLDRDCRSIKRTGRCELQPWDATYRDDPSERLVMDETQAEQANQVKAALHKLTPKRREAVRLRYVAQWPYGRIAERTGSCAGHVRSLVCSGLADLRAMVGA